MIKLIIQEIRPKQWLKNFLIFLPAIFANQIFSLANFGRLTIGLVSFSLAASSLYIINDIFDRSKDRLHPEKKYRPIASGQLSLTAAILVDIVLLLVATLLTYFIEPVTVWLILAYIILILAYSFYLKQIPIIDMMTIAAGFIIRIIYGSQIVHVISSSWILVTTFFFALFFVSAKRRLELVILEDDANQHRQVLESYNLPFSNILLAITATLSIASYTVYTLDRLVIDRFGTEALIYSVPFVFIFVTRLIYIVISPPQPKSSDPINIIVSDYIVFLSLISWLLAVIIILLWPSLSLN